MNFDILELFSNLTTDWKDNAHFMKILHKHSEKINRDLNIECNRLEGCLEIYPPTDNVFAAFDHFNMKDLKVVLVGQDVYINKGEANGLCFSISSGSKCPPSLRNIFKELENEYGVYRDNMDLTSWAKQGVLMLNRALTVRQGQSMSHMKIWRPFTEDVLKFIAKEHTNLVYILWGKAAQQAANEVDESKNLVLTWSHPSPLSRQPFVGNNHFKLCNEYLVSVGKTPIQWI